MSSTVTETPDQPTERAGATAASHFPTPGTATLIVLGMATVKLLGTMLVSDRYGFHRDELDTPGTPGPSNSRCRELD